MKEKRCPIADRIKLPALSEKKKALFLSDLHLGRLKKETERTREALWIKFLKKEEEQLQLLFLVGDIFDTWFEYKQVIPKGFLRLQAYLATLVEKGIETHYLVGNHDILLRDYLRSELGLHIHHRPIDVSIGDTRLYIAHGDGLGKGDLPYKLLRNTLSSSLFRVLFHALHPDIGLWLFNSLSRRGIRHIGIFKEDGTSTSHQRIMDYAHDLSKKYNSMFRYYIMAHTHIAHQSELFGGASYINLGDGIYIPSYAVLDSSGRLSLHTDSNLGVNSR